MEEITVKDVLIDAIEKQLRNQVTNIRFEIGGSEGRDIAEAIKKRFNLEGSHD